MTLENSESLSIIMGILIIVESNLLGILIGVTLFK
jgi:hypothetical protein